MKKPALAIEARAGFFHSPLFIVKFIRLVLGAIKLEEDRIVKVISSDFLYIIHDTYLLELAVGATLYYNFAAGAVSGLNICKYITMGVLGVILVSILISRLTDCIAGDPLVTLAVIGQRVYDFEILAVWHDFVYRHIEFGIEKIALSFI